MQMKIVENDVTLVLFFLFLMDLPNRVFSLVFCSCDILFIFLYPFGWDILNWTNETEIFACLKRRSVWRRKTVPDEMRKKQIQYIHAYLHPYIRTLHAHSPRSHYYSFSFHIIHFYLSFAMQTYSQFFRLHFPHLDNKVD